VGVRKVCLLQTTGPQGAVSRGHSRRFRRCTQLGWAGSAFLPRLGQWRDWVTWIYHSGLRAIGRTSCCVLLAIGSICEERDQRLGGRNMMLATVPSHKVRSFSILCLILPVHVFFRSQLAPWLRNAGCAAEPGRSALSACGSGLQQRGSPATEPQDRAAGCGRDLGWLSPGQVWLGGSSGWLPAVKWHMWLLGGGWQQNPNATGIEHVVTPVKSSFGQPQ
jgi:hypothetical protein